MRASLLALVAGCGAASPPVPSTARSPRTSCAVDYASSNRHAWLTSSTVPVRLLDVEGRDVFVATVRDDVVVTRRVMFDALAPVVTEKTAVSPRAGAPADPGVTVLAGFRLPVATSPWIPIHTEGSIEVTGFIPAGKRRRFWEESSATPRTRVRTTMIVRAQPRSDASVRGVIHPGVHVTVLSLDHAPWVEVQATGNRVSIAGFVEPPPPAPPSPPRTSAEEAAAEMEVPAPHGWWPLGTCLYDAPEGHTVGEVIGAVLERPTAGANGWSSITVETGWGTVRVHAREPVVEVPPPASLDWQFTNE